MCARCRLAVSPLARMNGLLGRAALEPGEGMLFRPGGSIHMFFMRFAIDAVFCDRDLVVIDVVRGLRPWRMASRRGAKVVIELAEGAAADVAAGRPPLARYDRRVSTQPLRQLLESAFPDATELDVIDRTGGGDHFQVVVTSPSLDGPLARRAAPPGVRGAGRAARRRHHPRTADQDEGSGVSYTDKIKEVIDGSDVAIFMKGTPAFAMCGNSDRALKALRRAGAPVTAVDVLPDPQIRQDLSAISGWPTIPQVFVKGELVGGADIVEELEPSGELEQTLREKLGDDYAGDARRDRPSRSSSSASAASASTSSACVSGLTLCMTRLTVPSSPITKVERSTPMYVLPMYFFSAQTP